MNSIQITGNLGKDVELRYLNDGTQVASFSVGDSQGRDKPAIWWNCSLFGKRAESLAPYLMKGQQVTVFGTLSEREYQDKEGNKRKAFDLRVNDVALQGGKREEAAPAPAPMKKPSQDAFKARQLPPGRPASGFDDMDDSVPF